MARTVYNTSKGLHVTSGTAGFVFDSDTPVVVEPTSETIDLASAETETAGTQNGIVKIALAGSAKNLNLNDGLALGQEKVLVITTYNASGRVRLRDSGGSNLANGNSLTQPWNPSAKGAVCLLLWDGSKWNIVNESNVS